MGGEGCHPSQAWETCRGKAQEWGEVELNEDRVVLKKSRYDELIEMERKLIALENAGVDNWDGYYIAMECLHEED